MSPMASSCSAQAYSSSVRRRPRARRRVDPRRAPGAEVYRRLRSFAGRTILLGLEVLVAADPIRTVAVEPSWESVVVLTVIVLIRTFLSFTLDLEIELRSPGGGPRG